MAYASLFVFAKGEATGWGGSDRRRIRPASRVPPRFNRRRTPSRVNAERRQTEPLILDGSPPRRNGQGYRAGFNAVSNVNREEIHSRIMPISEAVALSPTGSAEDNAA
jgi:hypothetical protein